MAHIIGGIGTSHTPTIGFALDAGKQLAQAFPTGLRAGGTGLAIGAGRGGAALGQILAGGLFSMGLPLSIVAPIMASGCAVAGVVLSVLRRGDVDPAEQNPCDDGVADRT